MGGIVERPRRIAFVCPSRNQNTVISTEAVHGLIVNRAVERSLYLPLLLLLPLPLFLPLPLPLPLFLLLPLFLPLPSFLPLPVLTPHPTHETR
jgi:hypothetical protein